MLEPAREDPRVRLAAEEYSKRLLVKQRIYTRLFEGLGRLAGISQDYFSEQFPVDLAERTRDIPDENLVAPPPSVAVPAIQALEYSLDEPDLKEMYLALLDTASDERRQHENTPRFRRDHPSTVSSRGAGFAQCIESVKFSLAEVRTGPAEAYKRVRTNLTPLVSFPRQERVRASLTGL